MFMYMQDFLACQCLLKCLTAFSLNAVIRMETFWNKMERKSVLMSSFPTILV